LNKEMCTLFIKREHIYMYLSQYKYVKKILFCTLPKHN